MIRTRSFRVVGRIPALAAGLALLTIPTVAAAQSRTLSWPEISVSAHLDADGLLHVTERQTMQFSGDWNGGERRFAVGFGQKFTFESLYRIEFPANTFIPLTEGEIDRVGGYEMFSDHTLRWRSRLPDDPPFNNTIRIYELAFTYGRILEPADGESYELSHDFTFADRESDIDRFTLELTLDPAWQPPADFTGRYEATALPPGNGFVVNLPLLRLTDVAPASVRLGASTPIRLALLALLIAGFWLPLIRLFTHEKRLGRFATVLSPASITPEWLKQELFVHLPEVAGAVWDDQTSQAEVAATLARLVQEGKLKSRVETKKILVFTQHVLHLELKTDRATLRPHERALIDKLFTPRGTKTDTDAVRKRYKTSGFDPAKAISPGITKLVNAMARDVSPGKASPRLTRTLMLVAVALVAIGVVRDSHDGLVALGAVFASLVGYAVARVYAAVWKGRISDRLLIGTLGLLVVSIMIYLLARYLLLTNTYRAGPFVLAGLVSWLLALINSVMNAARTQQSAERIATRKRLVAARDFFRAQLKEREPQLSDEWYPYMLAFGLGSHVDRWFKAFGGSAASNRGIVASSVAGASHSSGGQSSGGGSQGFTGFGGGGGFSGGGVGASFGAAIGGMAASVSPPSSSSSGGGGSSGGGSSGGGGGGGW